MFLLTLKLLFWTGLLAVVWSYAGYPLHLWLLARGRRRPEAAPVGLPSVTVIVAAYNEERHLAAKLDNLLALAYPKEQLQLIVASDCSTDGTHAIAQRYAEAGVELAALPERGGKTAAQNLAVTRATGDIVVFTDATTEFAPETLHDLLAPFGRPEVGCVGAELEYVSTKGSVVGRGAGAYWRYEKAVKALEARVHSLVGVSGCLYAVRRALYRPMDPVLISDFMIAGDVYEQGCITVGARGAVSRETTNEDAEREFDMRVRVAVRSINALVTRSRLLNPFRFGFFAYQLWSHKVLRYAAPQLLLLSLGAAVLIVQQEGLRSVYGASLVGGVALLAAAAVGWMASRAGRRLPLVHVPFYFAHVNVAALWAAVLYLRGERKVTWTTVRV
ncbi:MAG: glycosyltransferase family 2 protein [Gemmatimonas sp.]|uniref:glycosyltransferase family 2 protein n=1 Tax=Gemmatimonas sp. TaxID=1962908 RepID=UPI00391F8E18